MTDLASDARTAWPGEAAFARQLEDLDRQVSDWVAAVREARASLRQQVAKHAELDMPTTRGTEVTPPQDLAEQERGDQWDPADAPSATPPEAPAHMSPPARSGEGSRHESDEALLQSLDAEALRWVRIRQRIAPGKTVRELLAEFEETSPERSRE